MIERLESALKTRSLAGVFENMWGHCLLWKRVADGPPLHKLVSRGDLGRVTPSWSWMSVDGPVDFLSPEPSSVEWKSDVELPILQQRHGELEPTPQIAAYDESAAGVRIHATAFKFFTGKGPTMDAGGEPVGCYYDAEEMHDRGRERCIIIARNRHSRHCYVLLVSPLLVLTEERSVVDYERVGVGHLPDVYIDETSGEKVAVT